MEQLNDISFLFDDPRPTLPDTNLWQKLLRAIPSLEDQLSSEKLQRRLWTMRSIGVALRYQDSVWRFVAILDQTGGYETEKEFEDDKKKYLAPYAAEIAELLRKVAAQ
jgi:hypothetical protein